MPATAAVKITATVTGLRDGGQLTIGPLTPAATPVLSRTDPLDLASGSNAITPPVGAKVCIFVPPSANTQTITLKGVTGDTGVPLSKTQPQCIALDGSGAAFDLTTGGTIAGCCIQFL